MAVVRRKPVLDLPADTVLPMSTSTGVRFAVDPADMPAEIFGFESYSDPIGPVARVSRREAIQVPAVKRGRDLICGTIGQIPFKLLDSDNITQVSSLLEQPERFRARSVTLTKTVEDLLFEGKCCWWVTEYNFRNYPAKVEKLPTDVVPDERGHIKITKSSGQVIDIPPEDQVWFESPCDAVLDAGARAIRTYLRLASAADMYAKEPIPSGYFTPQAGGEVDPQQEEIESFMEDWATARRTNSTAFIPAVVKYETVEWSPSDLQMDAARQHAVLEIARVMGIDADDLQVSVTSRDYKNLQDTRIKMINDTLGMYISAIAERLSMPDVTPRGYRVDVDFNGFLRANDLERFQAYQIGVNLGIYDREAIAEREGLPAPTFPMPAPAPAQPAIEAK